MPYPNNHFQKIGMIARWKPVHLGHLPVLRALCTCAEHAFIGLGSANRYNLRNPFTLAETTAMIQLALTGWDNYTLLPVPDLDDGPRWRLMVLELFGPLDCFVTANPYVANLLQPDYPVIHPVALVSDTEKVAIDGTMVRRALARGENWQALVPPEIANYLAANQLDLRFRQEFGLEALALDTIIANS